MMRAKGFFLISLGCLWGWALLGVTSAHAKLWAVDREEDQRKGVKFGALPIFNYNSDRGLAMGAMSEIFNYGDEGVLPFESLITVQGRIATQGPRDIFLGYERTGLFGPMSLRAFVDITYSTDPFQRFYGLGGESTYDQALQDRGYYFYESKFIRGDLGVRKTLEPGFELFSGLVGTQSESRPNQPVSRFQDTFGSAVRQENYVALRLGGIWEHRDFEFIPSDGYYLAILATGAPSFLSNMANWSRLQVDYRRYDPILPNRWLWLATQLRYLGSSPGAPLPERAMLGSFGTLRGLPYNRYISNHALSLRAELRAVVIRWRVFGLPLKAGAGIFIDTGKIAEIFPALVSAQTQVAAGFSLLGSYFTDDFLGVADFGFSKDGMALYLRLGHAF